MFSLKFCLCFYADFSVDSFDSFDSSSELVDESASIFFSLLALSADAETAGTADSTAGTTGATVGSGDADRATSDLTSGATCSAGKTDFCSADGTGWTFSTTAAGTSNFI